ncbi:hypothetical protein [Streptomyces neyagawaensis]|uniref:Uncharacterized protein n=1 Tax=Streptomyces neyagawaensis TaxID=42238 RepID=A0ABV3BA02_9ACTN
MGVGTDAQRDLGGAVTSADVSACFDLDRWLIDRTIFSDQALYEQELRRVFAPSRLFLAHGSQFTKPGDFFTTYVAGSDAAAVGTATPPARGEKRTFPAVDRPPGGRSVPGVSTSPGSRVFPVGSTVVPLCGTPA